MASSLQPGGGPVERAGCLVVPAWGHPECGTGRSTADTAASLGQTGTQSGVVRFSDCSTRLQGILNLESGLAMMQQCPPRTMLDWQQTCRFFRSALHGAGVCSNPGDEAKTGNYQSLWYCRTVLRAMMAGQGIQQLALIPGQSLPDAYSKAELMVNCAKCFPDQKSHLLKLSKAFSATNIQDLVKAVGFQQPVESLSMWCCLACVWALGL